MSVDAKPILHGDDHRPRRWRGATDPGGADPMEWLGPGLRPASIAWSLCESGGITVPKTAGGAGFSGGDFIYLPLAPTTGFPAVQTTTFGNAANTDDPDKGFLVDATSGDLHNAGYLIYSSHYPVTTGGFSSGDDVSGLHIAAGFPGTYEMLLKAWVSGDAAAVQPIGVSLDGANFSFDDTSGFSSDGANGLMGNASFDTGIPAGNWRFTEPGSAMFDVEALSYVEVKAVGSTTDDTGSDVLCEVWNPGPDDVTVVYALYVKKLDGSGNLFTD